MTVSDAAYKAKKKYAKNYVMMTLNLNKKTNGDIIEYLKTKENKQGYLKDLIRRDMEGKV